MGLLTLVTTQQENHKANHNSSQHNERNQFINADIFFRVVFESILDELTYSRTLLSM